MPLPWEKQAKPRKFTKRTQKCAQREDDGTKDKKFQKSLDFAGMM